MIGSSCMHKVERRHWLMLTLPLLWLTAAFLIGGTDAFVGNLPTAQAVAGHRTYNGQHCTSDHARPSFGGTVVVDSSDVICSDLTSFDSRVVIRGWVQGNVVLFGGDVVIAGAVNGNISVYGGSITLQNSAHVNGDIHLCGGQANLDKAAQLHGTVLDCRSNVVEYVFSNEAPNIRLVSILTWILLGILLTSLLPEHVMLVRTTVQNRLRRSLVLGLLSTLLAPAIITVLVALIIALPLALLVAVGVIAAWALGTVAVGWLIGDYIVRRLAPQHNTRSMQVVVGLTVLVLAESLPYIGLFISIGAGLVGLGAVFLSRFGTRLYSPPRKPLSL
jgi:cytoskeletal protein CcmA (bactofilin family)